MLGPLRLIIKTLLSARNREGGHPQSLTLDDQDT